MGVDGLLGRVVVLQKGTAEDDGPLGMAVVPQRVSSDSDRKESQMGMAESGDVSSQLVHIECNSISEPQIYWVLAKSLEHPLIRSIPEWAE